MRCLDALLTSLAADFGSSVGSAGAAVSAYALSYSGFQLVGGPLGDRVGPYRVITGAAYLSAVAAAACAFASSLAGLIALRFVAGAVAAAIGPLVLAWISGAFAAQQRPLALARMTAAAIGGTLAGQGGGGVLGGVVGVAGVFVALSLVFAASGAALFTMARRRPSLLKRPSASTIRQRRRSGLLPLLGRPAVGRVLVAVAVQGVAIHLCLAYVGALLEGRFAVGPTRAGLLVALYGLGGLAFVLLAPRILDRSTPAVRAGTGGAILGAGFVAFALSDAQATAAAALFAIGFGFLLLHNVLQVMASDMAPDALGRSLSLFAAASVMAQALGAALGGLLYDRIGATALCLLSATILSGLGSALAVKLRAAERQG